VEHLVAEPAPRVIWSSVPSLARIVAFPARPDIVSAPLPPISVLSALLPVNESSPEPPLMFSTSLATLSRVSAGPSAAPPSLAPPSSVTVTGSLR
jgi:hypothetical protein